MGQRYEYRVVTKFGYYRDLGGFDREAAAALVTRWDQTPRFPEDVPHYLEQRTVGEWEPLNNRAHEGDDQ